jgi:hypothetical protein
VRSDITAQGGSTTINNLAGASNDCATCHDNWTYDDHSHHTTGNNQVSFDSAIDRSQQQDSPTTACDQCHTPSGGLSTWTGVYNEHNADCDTCHNFTVDATGEPGTPVVATVQTVITTDATANCVTCHTKKEHTQSTSTHGGHGATDFQWTAAAGSKDTCGSSVNGVGCHDDGTADNVIGTIHDGRSAADQGGEVCWNCHDNASGGDGTAKAGDSNFGVDGTAASASTSTHNEVCTDCHAGDLPTIHHDRPEATGGTCITCHAPDVGQTYTQRTDISMPANLACNWCHIYWGGGDSTECSTVGSDSCTSNQYRNSGGKVVISALVWDPDNVSPNLPAKKTALASHAVSENFTTPISDYAACFDCHGADTSKGGGFQVSPLHGFNGGYHNDTGSAQTTPNATNQSQIYGGPTLTVENNDHTYGRHPGWGNLGGSGMATLMNLNKSDGKAYYDSSGVNPKFPYGDSGAHDSKNFTYQDSFDVPWDNFGSGTVSAPQNLNINISDAYGNQSVPTTVTLVPLSLP